MKVLMINKFHYRFGGSEKYYFDWTQALREAGHEVISFSMAHPRNEPSPTADYFVSEIDLSTPPRRIKEVLRAAGRVVYSVEARHKMRTLLRATRPDIAHLHNYCYQLTPSILYALRAAGVPVVQTLHDYKLICPNQRLYHDTRKEICERCQGRDFHQSVLTRCVKNSLGASLLGCIEGYLYQWLHTYDHTIARFVTPSRFLKEKLVAYGHRPDRFVYVPNPICLEEYLPRYDHDGYFLFVGRLDKGKGLFTLLEAVKRTQGGRLWVVGEGAARERMEAQVAQEGLEVAFLGYRTGDELRRLIAGSMFTVLPSEAYENCPYSLLESLALGKPVVGSRIGGIPELIEDGVDGLLFEPGNVVALAACIQQLLDRREELPEMGRWARLKIEEWYSMSLHYQRMMDVYGEVLSRERGA